MKDGKTPEPRAARLLHTYVLLVSPLFTGAVTIKQNHRYFAPIGNSICALSCVAAIALFFGAGPARAAGIESSPLTHAAPMAAAAPAPRLQSGTEASFSDAVRPFRKGDAVRIEVAQDSLHFINGTYSIGDDGCVVLPVLGRVEIDTMQQAYLTAYLNAAYLRFLRYPTVQVQPLIRLSLLGGFARPGFFYISPSASVWDAVAMAGGPIREDGIQKISWERSGKMLSDNLLAPIQSGESLTKMGIQSGDQLWVTHVPKRDGWEIFITDVLPIISVSVSALATSATFFYVFQTYKGTK